MDAEGTGVLEKVSPQEYERMRRELAKVKTRDILKKGARLIRSRPQVKYGFIDKYQTIWPTRTMCRLLGVSSSGFYDWLVRPVSVHEHENAQLLEAIKHSHESRLVTSVVAHQGSSIRRSTLLRRTCLTGSLKRQVQTRNGLLTLLTYGLGKAGCLSPSSSTCTRGVWRAGRCNRR